MWHQTGKEGRLAGKAPQVLSPEHIASEECLSYGSDLSGLVLWDLDLDSSVGEPLSERLEVEARVEMEEAALQEKYDGNSGTITKLTNELAEISEELDDIKSQMDSRGNSMTDTSPLILIKKELSRIKGEVKQMDLRIGAVEHTLLQVEKKKVRG